MHESKRKSQECASYFCCTFGLLATTCFQAGCDGLGSQIFTFEDLGQGKTRYTARARHWTKEDKEAHEKMGFHEGWGICTDQLAALAKTI